jgi:hypothetical protein
MRTEDRQDATEQSADEARTSLPALASTEVTTWLEQHHAGAFAEEFHRAGYLQVADVDAAAVDEIVAKKERGTAGRLKNDLAMRTREAKPMVPPTLPEGTSLDLSKPEVRIGKDVTFTIPSSLSVESSEAAIRSPYALGDGDWVVLARNAALLYGFRMDGPAPVRARRPLLEWVVPRGFGFVRSEFFQARVESIVTYSEETATYVSSGFDKQSATVGYAFCAASFERSARHREARASTTKELHAVGRWKYPRATLFLDECTRLSPEFEQAIRSALDGKDPVARLQAVLDDYGHAVPQQVTLGGLLHFRHVRTDVTTVNERKVEQEYRAAVAVKYGAASASVGAAYGTGSETSTAAQQLADQTSFDVLGGDATLASNPAAWAPTVKDPQLWAVIDVVGLVSPIELLCPELRDAVKALMPLPAYAGVPAIEAPLEIELPVAGGSGRAGPATTAGFLLGLQDGAGDGARGSVLLASGRADQKEHDDAFFGGASSHRHHRPADLWFDVNGLCLPVPADADHGVWVENTAGVPGTRAGFVRTRFGFGRWRAFGEQETAAEDGFLAVALRAPRGQRVEVLVEIGGTAMAGASAHYDPEQKPTPLGPHPTLAPVHLERAALCVPVPAGSRVRVQRVTGTAVRAAWIPLGPGSERVPDGTQRSVRWTMGPAVPVEANTRLTARTDGILHGFVRAEGNGPRGHIRLYVGSEQWAGASVHHYPKHARFGRYASAMLPVGRGSDFQASYLPTSSSPPYTFWWTPITEVSGGS